MRGLGGREKGAWEELGGRGPAGGALHVAAEGLPMSRAPAACARLVPRPAPPTPACLPAHPCPPTSPDPCCLPRSDRPECELVEGGGRLEDSHYGLLGSLVHCNLMFREAGLQRLLTYVDNAMQRWAARRGRFDVLAGPRKAGRQGQAGRRGGRGGTEEE